MRIPLEEVLALPSFRAAGTRVVVAGQGPTMVRWVHSSEVFEMGSLLAGGEVLLTTGLGLHGRTAAHLEAYVDQLADAGLAALALELGRTFFEVPEPILAAARRRDLCVLAMPEVVPFERMVEDFHELVVHRRTRGPADTGYRALVELVAHGYGLRALLDEIARTAGCPVELRGVGGDTVERSRIATVSGPEEVVEQVRGPEGPLGTLHLAGTSATDQRDLARDAALAVALELGRTHGHGRRPGQAQSLVSDLTSGVAMSGSELLRRLAEQGWPRLDGRHLVPLAVAVEAGTPLGEVTTALEESLRAVAGSALVGVAGGRLVGVVPGWATPAPAHTREMLTEACQAVAGALPGVRRPLLLAGTPQADASGVSVGLARARELLETARRLGHQSGVLLARDVAAPHLLLSTVDPQLLREVAADQVGALIEHDRAHRSELLRTLDAYLGSALSKTRTAATLGLRRQSLYDRLGRIERLLGVSLEDPGHLLGLQLGLTAWRLRTGLDPQVGFGGG